MKQTRIFTAVLGLTLVFLAACKKEESKSPVLAQVGKATLTLEDLRESFPAEFEQLIRREQYLDFIKRWIDDEAVYQQAVKSKLEADPAVARKLEKIRRKLLIEEFLARENASEVFEPDEMAMNQYYEMHKEDFRRKVPEYKYAHIRVQTNKQAAELRGKAFRSDFLALAAANSLDPAPEAYASIAFKKLSEIPPCLAQEIDKAGIGSVTLPVACADGFYLVKVLERQDAGSLIPFAEAKEEISGTLIMDRKDKLLDNRISKYKENQAVSYNLENIPGLAENGESAPAPRDPAVAQSVVPVPSPAPVAAPQHTAATRPAAPSQAAPAAASAPRPAPPAGAAPASPSPAAAQPSAPADPRLPREPWENRPAAAPDPRLPREPWEEDPNAKPKPPVRKPVRPQSMRAPADTAVMTQAPPTNPELPETDDAPSHAPVP